MSGRGRGVRLSQDGVAKIALDIDIPLLAEIDSARTCPRAEWIRIACREKLERDNLQG